MPKKLLCCYEYIQYFLAYEQNYVLESTPHLATVQVRQNRTSFSPNFVV
jgi:hypothetical protein